MEVDGHPVQETRTLEGNPKEINERERETVCEREREEREYMRERKNKPSNFF